MKIIDTPNFPVYSGGKEYVVASGITNREYAEAIRISLNTQFSGPKEDRYFKIEEDDYVLQSGYVV